MSNEAEIIRWDKYGKPYMPPGNCDFIWRQMETKHYNQKYTLKEANLCIFRENTIELQVLYIPVDH